MTDPGRWRVQVAGRATEHAGREDAYSAVDDLRGRWSAGQVKALQTVRVYRAGEQGRWELVELVDFAREAALAGQRLSAVRVATARRADAQDRARRLVEDADTAWREAIFEAVDAGEPLESVRRAAGVPLAQLRRVLAGRSAG